MPKGKSYKACKVCGRFAYMCASATTCDDCLAKGLKYCKSCDTVKPVTAFTWHSQGLCYYAMCKACRGVHAKQVILEDGERHARILESKKRAYQRVVSTPEGRARYQLYNKRRTEQLVGQISTEEWLECQLFFNGACAYCGATTTPLEIEHIIPVSKGGVNRIYNVIPACRYCNGSKGAKAFSKWYPAQSFYSNERVQKIKEWFLLNRPQRR